jgi:hypothetical protein
VVLLLFDFLYYKMDRKYFSTYCKASILALSEMDSTAEPGTCSATKVSAAMNGIVNPATLLIGLKRKIGQTL